LGSLLSGECVDEALQPRHAGKIDQRERGGQRPVYQRSVDKDIDVPQPVTQDE
jgi:hypothetical protein